MAVSDIGIKIGLEGLSAVQGGLTQITGKLNNMDSATLKVGDAFKGMGSLITGALSIGAIGAWLKSAIDAADETFNLSQKVGIASKDLGGLKLAFQQAGVETGNMQKALVALSRNVLDGNKAFGDLGISVRNADGSLKGSKDVLYAVADVFKDMPDGIEKTALSTQLFGKAGADLIPMLNGGSDGLRQMADMAQKLGLVIDDEAAAAADEFNDTLELLGLGLQGVGQQVAAKLLPTLASLTGSLLETMTQGDALTRVADTLASGLKMLYSVAVGLVEAFDTVGKYLGGVAAAALMAVSGDFAGAANVLKIMKDDITDGWSRSGAAISKVWDDTGNTTVAQAAKIVKASNSVKDAAGELTKEQDKAKKAAESYATAGAQLAGSLMAQDQGLSGDFREKFDKLTAAYVAGKISLNDYQAATAQLLKQQPYWKEAVKAQEQALKDYEKTIASVSGATTKYEAAQISETESMRAALVQLRDQNEKLGLNAQQLAAREAKVLRNMAADKEFEASMQGGNFQLSEQARLLRERADEVEKGALVVEAKAAADEWKKTTDSINDGLTDALMRAFESGKGFMDSFKDTLVNAFKTMVLQPTIKAIMAPISGALGSLFSPGAMAGGGMPGIGATAGGGGFGGLMSAGMNLLNGSTIAGGVGNAAAFGADSVGNWLMSNTTGSLNSLGGSLMGNAGMIGSAAGMLGNGMAGYGISKALSGGYSAGGAVNTIAGIASMIPGIGPIAGVVGALVNRAFGMKAKEYKEFGIEGSISGGDATGQAYKNWTQKGGWFRSNKKGTERSAMDEDIAAALDMGAKSVLDQTKAWAAALNLPAAALANVTANFKTQLTKDEKENQAAIELIFEGYSNALTQQFETVLAPFQKEGEKLADTLGRLAALSGFSDSINQLGGIFSSVASSSIAARENIIGLAGGIDQLMAKAGQFVQDYYSVGEQAGMQAKSTVELFQALGIDSSGITSREDFRRLVESVDVSTEAGQQQLVALLDIAPQFAALADYIKEQKTTLDEVAKQAPVVAVLDQMLPQQISTTAAVSDVATRITQGNAVLAAIESAIKSGNTSIATGMAALATATENVAALQARIAASTAATATAVSSTASNTSLANSAPTFVYDIGAVGATQGA